MLDLSKIISPFIPEKTRTLNGLPVPSFGMGAHLGNIAGYDITLAAGSVVEVVEKKRPELMRIVEGVKFYTNPYFDPTNNESFEKWPVIPNELGHIVLEPGCLYLATSAERFDVPLDVMGLCFGKSTYARLGLIPFMTPLEPGWNGYLTLEFAVVRPLRLIEGAGIAQIVFLQGTQSASGYSGPYQNQATEAVGAKVGHDEIVVDWSRVPQNHDWVAVDKDKAARAYEGIEPVIDEYDEGVWSYYGICPPANVNYCVSVAPSFDWTQSLRRRPQ